MQVKNLRPNPFRRIENYPINSEKVESLKISIGETTFWDNLVARERNGHFEIAYGHHRLVALKELAIKEVNIPVRDIDDGLMIRIMANENLDDWKASPAVYTETVLVAKEYLDGELAKCETWEELRANKSISSLIDGEKGFRSSKGQGVGQTTILKFLGGNWKQWIIQDALNTIKEVAQATINKEAVNELPSAKHSKTFKKEVKKYNIPLTEQVGLAREIKKEGAGYRAVENQVKEHARITNRIPKPFKTKGTPKIDDFVENLEASLESCYNDLFKLVGNIRYIESNFFKDSLKTTLDMFHKRIEAIRKEF